MPPRRTTSAAQYLRGVMIALALALPMLSLAVLGTVWLWQNNALLIWSAIASAVALLIYVAEVWLVRRRERVLDKPAHAADETEPLSEDLPGATPREQSAWDAVEQLASSIDTEALDSREAVLELGARSIETVARSMHPGENEPLWKFTVPEALTLVERVSVQLRRFVVGSVPLGDRLTIGQLLAIYRWRTLANTAEKAYDLWRILRFVNPAAAVAGELREKISSQLLQSARSEFTRRLARAYVREVGRAAISLYSGRLRENLDDVPEPAAPELADKEQPPLRILVIGQAGVGKSSLINALGNEVQAAVDVRPSSDGFMSHALSRDDVPLTLITESPSLTASPGRMAKIVANAEQADAVLWIISAIRPDRAVDADTLEALREALASRNDRRPPPIICLLSHIDRVRPFSEWQPPYDLADREHPKSHSIAEVVRAAAEDLTLDEADIIPVAMAERSSAYNIELVWARLLDVFDDARNVQLLRRLSEGAGTPITQALWRQAKGAGRLIRTKMFT
jgi:predicted GTPase